MPAISNSLSAVAKPFSPESDSRLIFLTKKFNFLERIQHRAMQSNNSALLINLQMSFNLLFEEESLYFSTSDKSTSSVTECIFPPSLNIKLANTINPSVPDSTSSIPSVADPDYTSLTSPHLSARQQKKRDRAQAWKKNQLEKSSTTSVKSIPIVPVKPQRKIFSNSSLLSFTSRRPPVLTTPVSTTPVSPSHLISISIPASPALIPTLVTKNPDTLCDVASVSVSNTDSVSKSNSDMNSFSAQLNILINDFSLLHEKIERSAEMSNMSAEDVQLPSTKILYALESKSIIFCHNNQWCSMCGLSEHTRPCEHICPDCVSIPHPFNKCPELHKHMLASDTSNQQWYRDISQQIRQEFDGNPRKHKSSFKN